MFRQSQTARKVVHEHDNSLHRRSLLVADDRFHSKTFINRHNMHGQISIWLAASCSGNQINKVTLRQAWLVLGWVTVYSTELAN